MIGLLIDAAIAVIVGLDRLCSRLDNSRLRAASPEPVADAKPAGAESTSGTGGHLNNGHAEPLRWGPDLSNSGLRD